MIRELENEVEIIRSCQKGEIHAYEKVFRHFEQPLLMTALKMLHNKEDAQDAVQIAFIKLYHNIRRYEFRSKFSTYLFRIVVNVCLDMIKKRKNRRMQPLPERDPSYYTSEDLRLQLEEAISMLPDRMRACFVLFAVEEFKQSEIAEILDLSVGAVKAQIFHAKARLRSFLSDSSTGATL